jgi:ElaB/YqjD/DUF883 family membrane-anchored ribosome-binding protein
MTTETAAGNRTGGLQQTAKELAAEVGDTAEQQADSIMTNAGSTVHQVASTVRTVGDDLRGQQPQIARYTTMAADRMEDVASYLDGHQPRELLDEAQRFARRQPLLVVAGGLAVGLALGRLLRTAGSPSNGQNDGDWYRQGYRSSNGGMAGSTGAGYRRPTGTTYDRDLTTPTGDLGAGTSGLGGGTGLTGSTGGSGVAGGTDLGS